MVRQCKCSYTRGCWKVCGPTHFQKSLFQWPNIRIMILKSGSGTELFSIILYIHSASLLYPLWSVFVCSWNLNIKKQSIQVKTKQSFLDSWFVSKGASGNVKRSEKLDTDLQKWVIYANKKNVVGKTIMHAYLNTNFFYLNLWDDI